MSRVLEAIETHARLTPGRAALLGAGDPLTYGWLAVQVRALAPLLTGRTVGLLLDNGPAWVIADLAALAAGAVCVPMPTFFSDEQLTHLVGDAGVDLVLTDQPVRVAALLEQAAEQQVRVAGMPLSLFRPTSTNLWGVPDGTAKVTYTSGTTGAPKGVCLRQAGLETVAASLVDAIGATENDRTLCLLPLSILLENVANLYGALLVGGTVAVPAFGAAAPDLCGEVHRTRLQRWLENYEPTVLVMTPALLDALVGMVEGGWIAPASLRFIAVGGAPVPAELLARAQHLRLPVYQGYGLSEAGSVVSLDLPAYSVPGSVGRPLSHAEIRIAPDGEILVRNDAFLGYLGAEPWMAGGFWPTGDIGHLDDRGYLYVVGRRKRIEISPFGRNLSPQWLQARLEAQPEIARARVFTEGRRYNLARLEPVPGAAGQLADAVERVNGMLPAYARIQRWVVTGDSAATPDGGNELLCGSRA